MLIDDNFADINERKHNLFTVTKIANTFRLRQVPGSVYADFIVMTRERAWQYLRTH